MSHDRSYDSLQCLNQYDTISSNNLERHREDSNYQSFPTSTAYHQSYVELLLAGAILYAVVKDEVHVRVKTSQDSCDGASSIQAYWLGEKVT